MNRHKIERCYKNINKINKYIEKYFYRDNDIEKYSIDEYKGYELVNNLLVPHDTDKIEEVVHYLKTKYEFMLPVHIEMIEELDLELDKDTYELYCIELKIDIEIYNKNSSEYKNDIYYKLLLENKKLLELYFTMSYEIEIEDISKKEHYIIIEIVMFFKKNKIEEFYNIYKEKLKKEIIILNISGYKIENIKDFFNRTIFYDRWDYKKYEFLTIKSFFFITKLNNELLDYYYLGDKLMNRGGTLLLDILKYNNNEELIYNQEIISEEEELEKIYKNVKNPDLLFTKEYYIITKKEEKKINKLNSYIELLLKNDLDYKTLNIVEDEYRLIKKQQQMQILYLLEHTYTKIELINMTLPFYLYVNKIEKALKKNPNILYNKRVYRIIVRILNISIDVYRIMDVHKDLVELIPSFHIENIVTCNKIVKEVTEKKMENVSEFYKSRIVKYNNNINKINEYIFTHFDYDDDMEKYIIDEYRGYKTDSNYLIANKKKCNKDIYYLKTKYEFMLPVHIEMIEELDLELDKDTYELYCIELQIDYAVLSKSPEELLRSIYYVSLLENKYSDEIYFSIVYETTLRTISEDNISDPVYIIAEILICMEKNKTEEFYNTYKEKLKKEIIILNISGYKIENIKDFFNRTIFYDRWDYKKYEFSILDGFFFITKLNIELLDYYHLGGIITTKTASLLTFFLKQKNVNKLIKSKEIISEEEELEKIYKNIKNTDLLFTKKYYIITKKEKK